MAGVVISTMTTIGMTFRDWLENPGGIFRGPDGTSWHFVFDTAVSWLLPTFVQVAFLAFCLRLLWSWLASLRTTCPSRTDHPGRDPRRS